jgi:elongator complex protein 4
MSISFKKKVSSSKITTTTTTTTTIPTVVPVSTTSNRLPSGTRLNSTGTLLLTSSGIPSLDTFIGGGIPIGSLVLIYEDPHAHLSDSILRCYLSEGIYNKQDACVIAARNDLSEHLPVKDDYRSLNKSNDDETEQEKMKIAWRYENLSTLDTSTHVHYDLQSTNPLPDELIEQVTIHKFTWNDYNRSQTTLTYRHYLLYSSHQTDKRILRLAIQSFSSSLFDSDKSTHADELFSFLYYLRLLLRTSLATCVITLNEKSKLFETLADMVIELKLSNVIHTDYVAFCQLRKLPRLNSIQAHVPDTWDIAMKLLKHRKNLVFERYAIPPDLADNASRDDKAGGLSCSSSKQLDF